MQRSSSVTVRPAATFAALGFTASASTLLLRAAFRPGRGVLTGLLLGLLRLLALLMLLFPRLLLTRLLLFTGLLLPRLLRLPILLLPRRLPGLLVTGLLLAQLLVSGLLFPRLIPRLLLRGGLRRTRRAGDSLPRPLPACGV